SFQRGDRLPAGRPQAPGYPDGHAVNRFYLRVPGRQAAGPADATQLTPEQAAALLKAPRVPFAERLGEFCRFYSCSPREALAMEYRKFWMLYDQIPKLKAREDVALLRMLPSAFHFDKRLADRL